MLRAVLNLLCISPCLVPLSEGGVVAQTTAALAKGLRALGHSVTLLAPADDEPLPESLWPQQRPGDIEIEWQGKRQAYSLHEGRSAAGLRWLILRHPELRALRHPGSASPELRARLALAMRETLRCAALPYEGVHLHGEMGGWFLWALGEAAPRPRVLTLYNFDAQWQVPPEVEAEMGEHQGLSPLPELAEGEGSEASPLFRLALDRADTLTAFSPRLGAELGMRFGLSQVREIAQGLDPALWNPSIDPQVESRYDPVDLAGKERCKAHLQARFGFPVLSDSPLVGALAVRSSESLALLLRALPWLRTRELQLLVCLEESESELYHRFVQAAEEAPEILRLCHASDLASRKQLLSASDFLFIADAQCTYAHWAMAAHRYGAMPIVPGRGAYADALRECSPDLSGGSAFVYLEEPQEDVAAALQRALDAYELPEFEDAQRRLMRIDHSWERGVRSYDRLFRALHDPRQAPALL